MSLSIFLVHVCKFVCFLTQPICVRIYVFLNCSQFEMFELSLYFTWNYSCLHFSNCIFAFVLSWKEYWRVCMYVCLYVWLTLPCSVYFQVIVECLYVCSCRECGTVYCADAAFKSVYVYLCLCVYAIVYFDHTIVLYIYIPKLL